MWGCMILGGPKHILGYSGHVAVPVPNSNLLPNTSFLEATETGALGTHASVWARH